MSSTLYARHGLPVWLERGDANVIIEVEQPSWGHEILWCKTMEDGLYEVCCIPFFVHDVALGDFIVAHDRGDGPLLERVSKANGRFVYRIFFEDPRNPSRDRVVVGLNRLGALMEWSSDHLLAVDARDEKQAPEVEELLLQEYEAGSIQLETGRS